MPGSRLNVLCKNILLNEMDTRLKIYYNQTVSYEGNRNGG